MANNPLESLKKLVEETKKSIDIDVTGLKEQEDKWAETNEAASRALDEKAKPSRFR